MFSRSPGGRGGTSTQILQCRNTLNKYINSYKKNNKKQRGECSFKLLFIVIQVSTIKFSVYYQQYTIPILSFVQRGITSTQTPEYMLALYVSASHRYVATLLFYTFQLHYVPIFNANTLIVRLHLRLVKIHQKKSCFG